MTCILCGRGPDRPDDLLALAGYRHGPIVRLCRRRGRRCEELWRRLMMPMIDPDENETAALATAGECAGEYLDELGKTDLAVLTILEWTSLISVICGAYVHAMAESEVAPAAAAVPNVAKTPPPPTAA